MADTNGSIPNVMPDAMVEPITDMELINAKLKYKGEQNLQAAGPTSADNKKDEVKL